MKHTPGPWEYGFSHWGRWQIDSAKAPNGTSFHIAELAAYGGLGGKEIELNEQQKANARLIAAAPDLLEALKELSGGLWAGDGSSHPKIPGTQVAKARAAIAKATGES